MPGRGPLPKSADRRVRTNRDPIGTRIIEAPPAAKQRLPRDLLADEEEWHPATIRWWNRWGKSPLSDTWTLVDWSELEACALLHHEFVKRRTFALAAEIRLRMQKFGATPEDRARLRVVFADADERDAKRPAAAVGSASRERFADLHVLPSLPAASSE